MEVKVMKFFDAQRQLREERKKNEALEEKNRQLEECVNEQADALIELAEIVGETGGKTNG